MDHFEINCRIRQTGKTQPKIAKDLGISAATVNNVIRGRVSSFAVAQHIAELLECEVNQLWPDRYIFKPRKKEKDSRQQSLILTGETGTCKTWLTCAFGNQACRNGHSVFFTTASQLYEQLICAQVERTIGKLRKQLIKTRLLIIDDPCKPFHRLISSKSCRLPRNPEGAFFIRSFHTIPWRAYAKHIEFACR